MAYMPYGLHGGLATEVRGSYALGCNPPLFGLSSGFI
jgi:hypothetical protein